MHHKRENSKVKETSGEATIKSAPSGRTGLSLSPPLFLTEKRFPTEKRSKEYLSLISAAS